MDDNSNNIPNDIITTGLSSNNLLSLHSISPTPSPSSLASSPRSRKRKLPSTVKHYPNYIDSSYLDYLNNTAAIDFKGFNVKTKCPDDKFVVPDVSDYRMLLSYKYKKDQLKTIAKKYKLRVSGTNNELLSRVYTYLKLSNDAICIQKMFRGHLQRFSNQLRGPAFLKRDTCTNSSDFLTMEEMKDIPYLQFISYKDDDGFVYGFDILSLHNLKMNTPGNTIVENPYTRSSIKKEVFDKMKRLIKLMQRIYKVSLDVKIEKEPQDNVPLPERISRLFMEIDSHGHYSCSNWFTSLDKRNLIRYVSELADIWYYRASLTPETRFMICPHDPFRHLNIFIAMLMAEQNIDVIRDRVLAVMEALVKSGSTEQNRALGVLYVLQTLTLVNTNARESMPWLYEAVAYIV